MRSKSAISNTLEAMLYVDVSIRKPPQAMPDWQKVHKELSRPGVTLKLLWWEYKEIQPDGFQYTQFCYHYRQWAKHLDVVMRQHHKAGEKVFVDWAGQTVPIHNPVTGLGLYSKRPEWTQPDNLDALFIGISEIVDNSKRGIV